MKYSMIGFLLFWIINTDGLAEKNKLPDLYQQLLPSIVTLHPFSNRITANKVQTVNTPNGLGSGVIISEGVIVTASHVVHSVDGLHVEFDNGERRVAR